MDTTTSAGLLAYAKFIAGRPANDAESTEEEWYTLLTLGQRELYDLWAVQFPTLLLCDWTALTTSDNITFTLPSATFPRGNVIVRVGLDGRFLKPASVLEDDGDFVLMPANTIRLVNNKARTFGDTLYARWIDNPTDIDASTQPVLVPAMARELIAYKACALWAHRGGQRDPRVYESLFQKRWTGNPMVAGDGGMMMAIKERYYATAGEHLPDYAHAGPFY